MFDGFWVHDLRLFGLAMWESTHSFLITQIETIEKILAKETPGHVGNQALEKWVKAKRQNLGFAFLRKSVGAGLTRLFQSFFDSLCHWCGRSADQLRELLGVVVQIVFCNSGVPTRDGFGQSARQSDAF